MEHKIDLEKMKRLRKSKKISLDAMSRRLGYKSPNGYYYKESGRCAIDAEELPVIAEILGVSTSELYITNNSTILVDEQIA